MPESKGWIGQRYDADAGLQYLNARYYDPVLGMFLQPDWFEVLKPGVGTNRFSYSFNDPVNKLDPMGNDWNHTYQDEFNVAPVFQSMTYAQQIRNVCTGGGCAIVGLAMGGPAISVARSLIVGIAARAPGLFAGAMETGVAQATGMVAGTTTLTTKILGNPQVTRGADSLIHAATSVKIAITEVRKLGVGNIASIHFNRQLSAIFGIADKRMPDVTIISRNGCAVLCEVISKSQSRSSQLLKADGMAANVISGTGLRVTTVVQGLDRSALRTGAGLISGLRSLLGIR